MSEKTSRLLRRFKVTKAGRRAYAAASHQVKSDTLAQFWHIHRLRYPNIYGN